MGKAKKIKEWERKVKHRKKKELKLRQKLMWEKLSTVQDPTPKKLWPDSQLMMENIMKKLSKEMLDEINNDVLKHLNGDFND